MSCSSSSSSSQDEDKTPTAFAKQLYTLLDNDRQNVDRDSKYTAFWVALGMTLSSQYRQVRPHCLLTVCVSQNRRSRGIGSSACCQLASDFCSEVWLQLSILLCTGQYSQRHNTCTTLKTAVLSACRIGQHGDWQLKFRDPSTNHPKGKYKCGACYEAARRDWDPCEEYHRRRDAEAQRREAEEFRRENREDEDTEEGESEEDDYGGDDDDDDNEEEEEEMEEEVEEEEQEILEDYEGVADVHDLRQHAATRQHILKMQVCLLGPP